MKNIIYLSIILILIFSNNSIAQQEDLWTTFTTANGLADNYVRVIIESNDGALWFGTQEGVTRYFNSYWSSFNTEDGLVHNLVFTIFESSDGALWFGTHGGVTRYKDGKWTTLTITNGLADNIVDSICESNDGAMWFANPGTGNPGYGVSCYQNDKWTYFTKEDGLASNVVMVIYKSKDGTLWFGTYGGVSYFKGGIWSTFTTADGLALNAVHAIYESSDGTMWFGTIGGGLSSYRDGKWITYKRTDGLANNNIFTIYESYDRAMWFGTEDGVSRYKNGKWVTYTTNDGLTNNNTRAIFQSTDESLWFATFGGGVSRYEENIWSIIYDENHFYTICETSDGSLWFGKVGGAIRYKDNVWTNFTVSDGLAGRFVSDIIESDDGSLWFATHDYEDKGGVSQYKNGIWTSFTVADGLTHNHVLEVCEASDGALWFGTYGGGVSRYQDGIWITFTVSEGLASNYVIAIYESNDGALWFGTFLGGVSRYYNGIWTRFSTTDGLSNNSVDAILESSDEALWFGTMGGVSRYQNNLWTTFSSNCGLVDNDINTICESRDGALWFGTSGGGVSRYQDNIWTTFTTANGLAGNVVDAIYETSDGMFWFGTTTGLTCLKPDKIPPFTFIDKGPQNDSVIGTSTPLFIFKGKDYRTKQENLKYYYVVLDTNDIIVSGDLLNFFDETAIQPFLMNNGKYSFYVSARDNWGNIDPTPATRIFTVDITQPTTVIEYPAQDDTLSQIIPIIGYAYDDSPIKDFEYYSIYYGKGTDAKSVTEWKTLVSNNKREIRSDTLAIWDASGLRGTYQLILFAKDTLDHISEDIVSVHIVDATQEIKARQGGCIVNTLNNIELCFPPNSLPENIEIKISNVEDINLDSTNFKYMGLCYDIMPKDLTLKKPATLILSYADSILINVTDVNKLNIYRYNEDEGNWILIGGTVDEKNNKIVTSVTQLGRYGLFEGFRISGALALSNFNCQPRMFSPRGGGYNTETNISFYLGKDSNVTIKIFNMAGRLVNTLCENKFMTSGMNSIAWDGKDSSDRFCISGLYVVLIQAEEKNATKTVMVLNK